MHSPHNNRDLLFRDFQDFLSRKQHVPEKRLPYYLHWVSRFHEFCIRQNIDGSDPDSMAAYLHGCVERSLSGFFCYNSVYGDDPCDE